MQCKKSKLWPDRPDVYLRAYLPDDGPSLLAGRPRPAVILCPGGAYQICAENEGEPAALQFAAMGYHAFVLHYSVYGAASGTMGFAAPGAPVCERTLFPAAALDLARAVLTLREKAEELSLDPEKIAVGGFSAGAHNCAAFLTGREGLAGTLGCDPAALKCAAALLCYGVYDMRVPEDAERDAMTRAMHLTLLGEEPPSNERLKAVSPLFAVGPGLPPCFLWATAADEMVPVGQTLRMAEALAASGVPIELHVFERGGHAMSTATPLAAERKRDVSDEVRKWLPLAEAFLQRHMPLPL